MYVGLPSAWGCADGDFLFSLVSWESSVDWASERYEWNERMDE
jgi:hypothetical protein